jgi:hypothetical protein
MMPNTLVFSETQHALLFAWIGQAVFEQVGEVQGAPVLRRAVAQYGRERGGRMAQRARANSDSLSMANYMAYGEWSASPGVMEQEYLEKIPDARVRISRCPWYSTWNKHGLLGVGRYYCLEIDDALAAGFNPALQIEAVGIHTNGAEACEFIYHGAGLTESASALLEYKKAIAPGESARLPWEYHVGHLFVTLENVLAAELGPVGHAAVDAGLAEFGKNFGEDAVQQVTAWRGTDFSRLP